MRVRIVAPVLALATAVLLVSAACSTGASGGSTAPSSGSGSGSGALTASATSALQAKVDKFRAVPQFTAPGPSIDVSSLRGKSIFIVPETNNVFNNVNVAQMKSIASSAGMTATVYDNQGTSSQWVQGIQTAISQHVDLIILANAPDPRALQPQLAAAKSAGIPVVVTHFYDDSSVQPPACEGCAAGVTALETAPFNTAAQLLADWVILQAKGNVDALIPIVGGVIPSPGMQSAIQHEFTTYCPKCSYKFINIPLADFASSKLGTDIQASVSGDPNVNWIIDQLDSMEPATLTAINTASRNGKINVVGYNGSTFAIKDVQGGSSPMVMDVGESAPWIGYATMDQAFRVLLGKPMVAESAPVRVFDSTNATEAGNPPSLTQGYGDSYVNGFKQLWGMS
jgi:ribose transport system substrate-binding protein